MPFLTDTRCKQKYSIADIPTMVCAGETGENKDTCQVSLRYRRKKLKMNISKLLFI